VERPILKTGICPVCNSSNTAIFFDGLPHALDHEAFGSSRSKLGFGRILRCAGCAFGFSETRPTEDQLKRLYSEVDMTVYESEARGRMRTARRHQKILQRYVSPPGRILDIGCASGRFLQACADAGWNVVGLEPSRALCAKAAQLLQGAQILPLTLQEADFPAASFEAVAMWDVLEHVPDPGQFLQKAASLLKPGGFLLANVPNLDSLQAGVLRQRWPLLLPEHLNYFNRQSLRLCGEQAGLQLIKLGSRPVSFSVRYVLHRVGQHMPSMLSLARILSRTPIADWLVPVWMGELYAVWKKAR